MAIFRSKQDEPSAPLSGAPTGVRLEEPPDPDLTQVGQVLVERQLLTTQQLGNILRTAGSASRSSAPGPVLKISSCGSQPRIRPHSSTVAANTGSVAARRAPMPGCCEPWPEKSRPTRGTVAASPPARRFGSASAAAAWARSTATTAARC